MSRPFRNSVSAQFSQDDELSNLDMRYVMRYVHRRFGEPCVEAEKGCLTHDFSTGGSKYEHKLDHKYWKTHNVVVEVFSWPKGKKQWLYHCTADYLVVASDGAPGVFGKIQCYRWPPMKRNILDDPLKYYAYSKMGGDRYGMQLLAVPEEMLVPFLLWDDVWKPPTFSDLMNERRKNHVKV